MKSYGKMKFLRVPAAKAALNASRCVSRSEAARSSEGCHTRPAIFAAAPRRFEVDVVLLEMILGLRGAGEEEVQGEKDGDARPKSILLTCGEARGNVHAGRRKRTGKAGDELRARWADSAVLRSHSQRATTLLFLLGSECPYHMSAGIDSDKVSRNCKAFVGRGGGQGRVHNIIVTKRVACDVRDMNLVTSSRRRLLLRKKGSYATAVVVSP